MPRSIPEDIDIARAAAIRRIGEIAARLGVPEAHLYPFGHHKAKIAFEYLDTLRDRPNGKLILVTAISPTTAGEGKTTLSVGLTDGLNRIGKKAAVCLREPSLGPCFGLKGGAAGGGYSQVVPMEDINLHFTGDFHAITAANNLLAAMIDNHVYWGNELGIDLRRVTWRRAMDMNDRSLRAMVTGLGGAADGNPRETGFNITVASEVMAIFCLAENLADLQTRLGNILFGYTFDKKPLFVRQLGADGAMTVLLKDALMPNLVQTLEGNPAFVHGGPFANIAHGCNSVVATKTALKLADYVVTEAGFGADLGAEKFFDIKCRKSGLKPAAAVLLATVRALKTHGKVDKAARDLENVPALVKGLSNLRRHIANLKQFGVPAIVAINRFDTDSDAEIAEIVRAAAEMGTKAVLCTHWADGSRGSEHLAREVAQLVDSDTAQFAPLYPDDLPLFDKVKLICTRLYGADEVLADKKIRDEFASYQTQGYGHYPICMAKTPYSFSTDPNLLGAPTGHGVPIREIRLATGAGFLVVICGEIMTMPGLPRDPAATRIRLNDRGLIEGLS
ncbi:MAG: formate--tetrahydrofolate ligase [Deltaproteobacteria bacterium]|nr:formate--tetrahydrofolate ligase [Deltaproteobacteria bacterium]